MNLRDLREREMDKMIDPGSNPGNSYPLGHDNQLGYKHTSYIFGHAIPVKMIRRMLSRDSCGGGLHRTDTPRRDSVETDPEANWPSCPQSGQTQALFGDFGM